MFSQRRLSVILALPALLLLLLMGLVSTVLARGGLVLTSLLLEVLGMVFMFAVVAVLVLVVTAWAECWGLCVLVYGGGAGVQGGEFVCVTMTQKAWPPTRLLQKAHKQDP